ncbi:MAG: DUF4384 domain-containing protein [Desulfuromonadales bacterium]|nr:DUF4384 domain-containing protein [Desulfuromonadales bacterium]
MLFFRLSLCCLLPVAVFLASCASAPHPVTKKELQIATQYPPVKTLLRAVPTDKPAWVFSPPEKNDHYAFFVGVSSEGVVSEKEARSDALRDAVEQFVNYTGVNVSVKETIRKSISGQLSQGLDGSVSGEKMVKMGADAFVSRIKATDFYFEQYDISRNGIHEKNVYKYYVKASVPLTEYDRVREWARQQAEAQNKSRSEKVAAVVAANATGLSQVDNYIANGQALAALSAISAEHRRLQSLLDSAAEDAVTAKARELQALLPGRARAVSSRLILDSGRFGTTEIGAAQDVVFKAWGWFKSDDGALLPVAGLPLSINAAHGAEIADTRTGSSGEATFYLPAIEPGQYYVNIDFEKEDNLEPMIGLALRNVGTEFLVIQGQPGVDLAVKNMVRKLFAGSTYEKLTVKKLEIGSITYGDTHCGSGFALELKRRINEQLANIDGLEVIVPQTGDRQDMIEHAIKTRGISVVAKGGLGAAATHAAVDGADAALNAIYALKGRDVFLNVELKEAGSDRLLGAANTSFDSALLPPGTDLVPPQARQPFDTSAPPAVNAIKLEVTSHLGDGQTYRSGETISYLVNSDTDAYLLLIYEDVAGNLIQLLPNRYSGAGFYPKGTYLEVPDKADRERFEFTIAEPFGLEHVWAFAATQKFPELAGDELENGLKLLHGSFSSIRDTLRKSAELNGSAYGEAHSMITTVAN